MDMDGTASRMGKGKVSLLPCLASPRLACVLLVVAVWQLTGWIMDGCVCLRQFELPWEPGQCVLIWFKVVLILPPCFQTRIVRNWLSSHSMGATQDV